MLAVVGVIVVDRAKPDRAEMDRNKFSYPVVAPGREV